MIPKTLIILLGALTTSFASAATEEEDPFAPQSETESQAGGYWELNGHSGQYKVVVITGGFDHITTSIHFEWVEEPRLRGAVQRIARTVVLYDNALVVASVTSFKPDAKGVTVEFGGEARDGSRYFCRFILRPAGVYATSAGC